MVSLKSQLGQVLRRLGRSPKFTGIALLTLAIGIGANTAIFSVVDGVLLKALPYPHPDRLVDVDHAAPGFNLKLAGMAPALYFIYRDQSHSFQDIGIYQDDGVNVTGSGRPEHLGAEDVTDGVLLVHAGRRSTLQPGYRGAHLRVLATQVWRRPLGYREDARR